MKMQFEGLSELDDNLVWFVLGMAPAAYEKHVDAFCQYHMEKYEDNCFFTWRRTSPSTLEISTTDRSVADDLNGAYLLAWIDREMWYSHQVEKLNDKISQLESFIQGVEMTRGDDTRKP